MGNPGPRRRLTISYLGDPNSVHTRRWLSFFAGRGHAVHLILASDQGLTPGLDERVVVHPFPHQPRRRIRFVGALQARWAIRRLLSDVGTEILHAHYLTGYAWIARLSGFSPYVVTVWGSDVFLTARESRWARGWAWAALRGAARVTADSKALAEAAIALGARRERIRLVQFGVDTEHFTPGPPPAPLRERLRLGGCRVIFVPRTIRSLYRTEIAVNALAGLPGDVALVLTRKDHDPSYLAAVESRIGLLGLEDRVRFVPAIEHEEMPDYYRLADVVLSIPETDGTPVSVLEAMACARPVVASDLPSVREWLSDVTPELLVPVGDAPATTEAIASVLARHADLGSLRTLREVVVGRADHRRNMLAMETDYLALAAPE